MLIFIKWTQIKCISPNFEEYDRNINFLPRIKGVEVQTFSIKPPYEIFPLTQISQKNFIKKKIDDHEIIFLKIIKNENDIAFCEETEFQPRCSFEKANQLEKFPLPNANENTEPFILEDQNEPLYLYDYSILECVCDFVRYCSITFAIIYISFCLINIHFILNK